jgi:hypothetical protein
MRIWRRESTNLATAARRRSFKSSDPQIQILDPQIRSSDSMSRANGAACVTSGSDATIAVAAGPWPDTSSSPGNQGFGVELARHGRRDANAGRRVHDVFSGCQPQAADLRSSESAACMAPLSGVSGSRMRNSSPP